MEDNKKQDKAPLLISYRAVLALTGFLGFANMYAMKVDLSVAMVCMVNQTALEQQRMLDITSSNMTEDIVHVDKCSPPFNTTKKYEKDGEFEWNKSIQGLILGSFFWGYLVGQVPGGYLSAKFGGKLVLGWGLFICAVATLVTPFAARIHYSLLIIVRVIAGLGQSVVWPAMTGMWGYWAPPLERSILVGFTFAGAQIGNVIAFPLSGILCEYGFDGGWPTIFYVLGAMGISWFPLWMFLVADSPEKHRHISVREKEYIQRCLEDSVDKTTSSTLNIPWLAMAKSVPVWGLVIQHMMANWATYTFLTNMPTYLKEVFHFNIKSNGALSAIPYIANWAVIIVSGVLADVMRHHGVSTTVVRKLFSAIGCFVPSALCIALGYIDCSHAIAAVICMTLAVAFIGCQYGAGFLINPGDIAPKYAALLFAFSNSAGTLPGFLAPYAIGKMTPNGTQAEWRGVFFLTAAITSLGSVIYIIMGSGEQQPWAHDIIEDKKEGAVKNGDALDIELKEALLNGENGKMNGVVKNTNIMAKDQTEVV